MEKCFGVRAIEGSNHWYIVFCATEYVKQNKFRSVLRFSRVKPSLPV
jgi:hypothetical protein